MKIRIVRSALIMMLLLGLSSLTSLSALSASPDVVDSSAGRTASVPAWVEMESKSTASKPEPPDAESWDELPPDVRAKVDPRILAELRGEVTPAHLSDDPAQANPAGKPLDKTRFLVHLKAKVNLEAIAQRRFTTRTERRTAVFDALLSTARSTQGPLRVFLDARMGRGDVASYQPFYIFNGFAVEGNRDTIIELAKREDVERIVANYPLMPLWDGGAGSGLPLNDLEGLHSDNWNIDLVDAERVWDELGIAGEGAVVAGIDTGVDWTHPALRSRYRGCGPAGSDHNYNWFDPNSTLYPGGNLGPSRSMAPFDNGDHGTHTMGTMVGDGGIPGTQVGMAPGARWIAISLNELSILGSAADDIMGQKAFQWMLCPTDLSGTLATADCSKAPDVVNNSWGSANPADDTFRPAIQALRAAGIAPVFASGNPSAGAGSIGSPGSIPEAITVGATDEEDNVASFSGRGPSFYEGEQKPELSAPGVDINSTVPGGGYSGPSWSGTSMAAPHVAGLVALMVSCDLQDGYRDFNVDELERFMERTAVDLGDPGPDDDYGYGRIDAYRAVRWVRSAGDLQGAVRDASTNAPVAGATVAGVRVGLGDTFSTQAGASGRYSTTVPAGTYDVTVDAWGYASDTFSGQMVIAGALSVADFSLTRMPTAALTGRVLDGPAPVNGARVYVVARPSISSTTRADGAYALTLPVGTHEIAVEAAGYRILREGITVASGGSTHEFTVVPAPTILLVDADTYAGWFVGWPVHHFFQWALDQEDYLYDVWQIQNLGFNDTQVMPDGSIGYGIPSSTTLSDYDLVIWAHGKGGSTVGMGVDDELMDYLDGGGRLIISGQDIGWSDDGTTFYNDYLCADYVMDAAAGEGDTVSGSDFMDGLNLEITNASLHGYPNGATGLWPDAAMPEEGAAFPVLTYDNGNGGAALAVDPCDATYRAVYFALGYENIAPRAENCDPAIAEVLDRSIEWVMDSKPAYGVSVFVAPSRQVAASGDTVTYDLQVANRGSVHTTFELRLTGNDWLTRILSGTTEATLTPPLAPCEQQELTVEVSTPGTADTGEEDTAAIAASRYPAGTPSASADVTTVAFPLWQIESPMPTPRYRLAAANMPGDVSYYAIGGLGGPSWGDPMSANEGFNACTGEWEMLAPLPTARGNMSAAVIDGKIYTPGGYAWGAHLDVLEIYDPATDSWSTGARLPQPLSGAAVAAYGGKLYTFGGADASGDVAQTYEYDPVTDTWTEKAPMLDGGRAFAAAVELNGEIYVAGGWPDLRTVEVYDPTTDSWSTVASMNVGRQSPGLTAAPDGYLYVSGGGVGWTGLNSAERYIPSTDTWEVISSLNDFNRAGSASAYAGGQVFAVGGSDQNLSDVNESLRLFDSFCLSEKHAGQSVVQPGDRVIYTVEVHSDLEDLMGASLVDPIPTGTTFAGFGFNPVGAIYNSADDRVEWSGMVPARAAPLTFTFGVDVAASGWRSGDVITNAVTFASGAGLAFTRTAGTTVLFPDASPSVKQVNRNQALAGEVLTYTIRVENGSPISDVFTLRDPIPASATYAPGSLACTMGTANYDPVGQVINWTGVLPDFGVYVNTSGEYEWGDSDGNGAVPGVAFDWIDATSGSVAIGSPTDDGYAGPFDIGFAFNYYGTDYNQFYVNSNGSVQFGGGDWWYDECPIDSGLPNNTIHLLGGDWLVDDWPGQVYYQTFGTAPNRYTVIEFYQLTWHSAPERAAYDGSEYSNLEVILYENGAIKLQYEDMADAMTSGTIGIDDSTGAGVVEYLNTCPATIHDDLAVLFLPDGASWMGLAPYADVTFAVTTAASLPVNTWITNTATIAGPAETVERSAGTLINSMDLSGSWKKADRTHAGVGDVVHYELFVENMGLLTATAAALVDSLPAEVGYVPGSLTYTLGSAGYDPVGRVITWTGTLPDIAGYAPGGYEWGDSDGNGVVPGVTFDWIDISGTGTHAGGGENGYFCGLPIGFTFNFYGIDEMTFCVSTNGFVSFDPSGYSDLSNDCPSPDIYGNAALIAGVSGHLVVDGGIYYQTFGTAPNRYLVVQWANVRHYDSSTYFDFEIILYENLDIKVQMLDARPEVGFDSTTGIEDYAETQGLTYACHASGSIHDTRAVFFQPILAPLRSDSATVSFDVTLTTVLPDRTPVINTATLDDGYGNRYDLEAVFLARGSNLSASFKQADPGEVDLGDTVTYTVYVRNAGGGTTTGVMRDELPSQLSYETGSLVCGTGSCSHTAGVIAWAGTLAPRSMVPVRFRATVLASGGTITNTAVITDAGWGIGYSAAVAIRFSRNYIYLPLVVRND